MSQDTLYELSRRSILINKNEETSLIWSNSCLTARTDKCIHFFNFSHNLGCLDKIIDCVESSMITLKGCPAPELFKCNVLKREMRSSDLSELILDPSLWPHNEQLMQEMTISTAIRWSPKGFLHNEGILAVLNNLGSVGLFVLQDYKWESLINLSKHAKEYLEYKKYPVSFQNLREAVYILGTDAICWAPTINLDNSCYFVTAQKNRTLLFWSIEEDTTKISIKGKLKSDNNCEITGMIWIQNTSNTFWLICTNVLGQIFAYDMFTEKEEIKLNQCHTLWQYKDRMLVKNMSYTIINNNIIFICSKHRHLLVQKIDINGKIMSQYLHNINDYRITCITNSTDTFYVTTVNFKVYKFIIHFKDDDLNINLQDVVLKDTFPTCELHSIAFSANNVICTLGMVDRRMLCRKESHRLNVIFMSTEKRIESVIPKLLTAQSLTNYWDCIELLRYKMVKHKILLQSDCNLIAMNTNINKLKIELLLAMLYINLKNAMRIIAQVQLPNDSVENIREQILLNTAVSLLKTLTSKGLNLSLNDFEEESFAGAKKYVEYYCKKYKKDVSEFIEPSILSKFNSNFEYLCQCCDEKIEGFTCKDGHLNNFCSQSFTPITNHDFLSCKCCGYTVKLELWERNPLCVFCDLYLINTSKAFHKS